MKVKVLKLNEQERRWLLRNSEKIAKSFDILDEDKRARVDSEIALWKGLVTKLSQGELPLNDQVEYGIKVSRQELREIQKLTLGMVARLLAKTIPAYEQRIQKDLNIQEYLDAAHALVLGLSILSNKVAALL